MWRGPKQSPKQSDSHITRRIVVLEEWMSDVDNQLDASARETLRKWVETTNKWRAAFIVVATMFGITGATVYSYLSQRIENASAKFETRLNNIVDERVITDAAMKRLSTTLQKQYEQKTTDDTLISLNGILSGAKTMLEMRLHSPADESTLAKDLKPVEIKDLIYEVNALLNTYSSRLESGDLSGDRRTALLYTMNGIVDRASGDNDSAKYWFGLANNADKDFPESRVFLARMYFQTLEYEGKGKWSNQELRQDAIQLLEEVQQIAKEHRNDEARKSEVYLHLLKNNFPRAITAVDNELRAGNRKKDARMYYRKGWVYWLKSRDEPSLKNRENAALCMLQALEEDVEYSKALNNYVWMMTHHNDSKSTIVDINTVSPQAQAELKERLGYFQNDLSTRQYPPQLNTLAEAYYALGNYKKALYLANESVRKTKFYMLKADVVRERRDYIKTLIAEKIKNKQIPQEQFADLSITN